MLFVASSAMASVGGGDFEYTRGDHEFEFDLVVGLGLWRTPIFRVRAGPMFRTSVDFYDSDLAEVRDFGVGGRARRGLNWHLGARVSVSPSIGYPYLSIRETIKDDFGTGKFDGHEHLLTARFVFFFRSVRISSRPLEHEFLRLPVISWTSST